MFLEIAWGRDHFHMCFTKFANDQAGIAECANSDRNVKTAFGKVNVVIGQVQFDCYVWVLFHKSGCSPCNGGVTIRNRRGHADSAFQTFR